MEWLAPEGFDEYDGLVNTVGRYLRKTAPLGLGVGRAT